MVSHQCAESLIITFHRHVGVLTIKAAKMLINVM